MQSRLASPCRSLLLIAGMFGLFLSLPVSAQQLAKRLILKDGSYQPVTEWQIKGNRVRYLSAERGEWEELPTSLVDWAATEAYDKGRASGTPPPEAVELDKELAAERQAEEAKMPQVAPGLRLVEDSPVCLLDTFEGQPQLVDLPQNSGQLKKNMKGNILRAAINPVASAKQTIELPGPKANVQSHATLPAIYINTNQEQDDTTAAGPPQPQAELPWDRFKIVRVQATQGKRIVGDIRISVVGKTKQEQKLVPTTSAQLTGGWVKVTPTTPLAPGEYALVEMLGKEGMNLYVWDFGVNPSAPANASARRPEAAASKSPAPRPQLTVPKQ